MLFTHRGVVDDEGIIRLLEQVDLKEGTHVLVTVADPHTLIALLKSPGRTRLPSAISFLREERLREELEEDAAWAYLLKDRPS